MAKKRQRRGERWLPLDMVLLRGNPVEPEILRRDALENRRLYGFLGVSVFGASGARWDTVAAARLPLAGWVTVYRVLDLAETGLEVWDTGQAPHYDLVHEDLDELVLRSLGTAHRIHPNPTPQGEEP